MSAAPLPGIERIAVLRPGAIGDHVFLMPALTALRAAYPHAQLTLIGRRWHREFLHGRPGPVDEVLELPTVPGVGAPAGAVEDLRATEAFVASMQARRFDLALQLYGGGGHSNPFLRRLGARIDAGLRAADAPALDVSLDYRPWQNERLRLLEAVSLVGAPAAELAPRLAVTAADAAALAAEAAGLPEGPVVVLQPGATDPRRHWPPERFAAVGDALAGQGARIVLNGSADETALTGAVAQAMRRPVLDLGGRLSLSALSALLARAALVVSNDTGPLHLAQAIGVPTVGIYWFLNLLVCAPLVTATHRHAFSSRLACPVCGRENLAERCEHDASFVADVTLEEVMALAQAGFEEAREAAGHRLAAAAA